MINPEVHPGPRFIAANYLNAPHKLVEDLVGADALNFLSYEADLYPASALDKMTGEATGMDMAWLRDNAHVIAALYDTDFDKAGAIRAGEAVLRVLQNNEPVLDAAINNPQDERNRLTVRVNGHTLEPDDEPRIQNDSTGYALWITSKLLLDGAIEPTDANLQIIAKTARYLGAIEYWHEADDSHWEEDRRIHMSSIGVAIAGLTEAQKLLEAHGADPDAALTPLIEQGRQAMHEIWDLGVTDKPHPSDFGVAAETGDWPDTIDAAELVRESLEQFRLRPRPHDAALLFLVEPLDIVDPAMAASIVGDIEEHLIREHGVARYPGDTYWSPHYKVLTQVEERTRAAEGRTEERNLKAAGIALGQWEAQWTLFDPLLSSYYGKQFQQTADPRDRVKQLHYLNRSLSQLVPTDGGFRMPEAYYLDRVEEHNPGLNRTEKRNKWIPNDHVPLLWSQANLLRALKIFEDTTPINS